MSEKLTEIQKIDKNMIFETSIKDEGVAFYDVRKPPFDLYGLCETESGRFHRIPESVAKETNSGVVNLNFHTAGGRVRFKTDSPYVGIKVGMKSFHMMPHMAPTGSSGFDLYVDNDFRGVYKPPLDTKNGFEGMVRFGTKKMRSITINFPLYNDVTDLYIALDGESKIEHGDKYRFDKPVVFYGSSITQGGCASRPGNAYQSIISRELNVDHINLGFSGSGRGEKAICEYMASLPMCMFVSDYDHNAPNPEHLAATHFALYETIRAKHPDIPYIMITRPDVKINRLAAAKARFVVEESYRRALALGDKRVYYIDGEGFFRGPFEDACTVDGCHPNDLGFALMADGIGRVMTRAFHDCLFI